MRPIAARPIGPHPHAGDPTLPPMALPVSMPRGGQPAFGVPDQRKLIIGIISATIVIVVIAIVATLIRGGEGEQVASSEAPGSPPSVVPIAAEPIAAAAPEKAPKEGDPQPDNTPPEATLPVNTWGTNEVLLASRAGVPASALQRDVNLQAPEATHADPPANDEKPKEKAADPPKATNHEEARRATNRPTTRARKAPRQTTPKLKRRAAKRPTRTASRARRRASRPTHKTSATAARKKALALYRKKDFNGAASALRDAAGDVSDDEADKLRATATNYETVGVNMTRAQASETSNPTSSMAAYRRALALDKRTGDGAHAAYIRIKLGQVAPKAAASYMAQKKYVLAKKAADAAVNYGAGSHPTVKRVRSALERKATDFYKQAIGIKKSNPTGAKSLLRRVLHIVPPDSPWYAKAYKLLNARKGPRDDDE